MGEPVSAQMKNILALEQKEIKEVTDRTMIEVGDEAVEKLKATSPKRTKYKKGNRPKGRYARGWRKKNEGDGLVVYNATDWQLTHLLNNGHAIVNRYGDTGDRTNGDNHIGEVEDWAKIEFPLRISRGLK